MTGILGIGLALCAQLLIVLGFIGHSMVALLLGFACLFESIHLLVKAMRRTYKERKIMNLISCDNCGVILDANKLKFPEDIYDEEGDVIKETVWDGDTFVAVVPCPVCGDKIKQPGK